MGAFDILHHLRERGLTVEPGEPGRLIVRPASKLTDDLRERIRAHKAELIDLLAADKAAAPARPLQADATSCATCTHRTAARTCGDPEAAGLADRFRVVWLDLIGNHGATCKAHQAREQRQPQDEVPRLTQAQQRAAMGWDDADIAQAGRYMRQAGRHGFDLDLAERITDDLMLRDRQQDDRRMCIECLHLDHAGRCGAARAGRLVSAGRDLQPVKGVLMRCPGFNLKGA